MTPFTLLAALLALPLLFAGVLYARRRKRIELEMLLRQEWGQPRAPRGELDEIAINYRLRTNGDEHDERTWSDLDLDALFRFIDRTRSSPGQQTLYRRLRQRLHDDLPLLDAAADRLQRDGVTRRSLEVTLSRLRSREACYLPHLFADELPAISRWRYIYPLLSLLLLLAAAAAFINPLFIPVAALLILLNSAIQMRQRSVLYFYIRPLRFVHLLIDVARQLAASAPPEMSATASSLSKRVATMRTVERMTSWLNDDEATGNDLIALARHYANMFLLVDVITLSFSLGQLRRRREELQELFDGVGWIDVAISTASWRESAELWCRPSFFEQVADEPAILSATQLRHPLLSNAVSNSVDSRKSLLVTGSNMSGKSTFLRTIGINAITAQALATVTAESYCASRFEVFTSIGRSDDLLQGKSYYLAEVERVALLLSRLEVGRPQLFILDELFRGTNTTERIAASYAVLRKLVERDGNLTIVATHDLELAPMLSGDFVPFHFRELIADGELTFDYKLTAGVSSTRNAIALLELMKFPHDVVEDARRVAEGRRN